MMRVSSISDVAEWERAPGTGQIATRTDALLSQ
jgi:hypothetical protein